MCIFTRLALSLAWCRSDTDLPVSHLAVLKMKTAIVAGKNRIFYSRQFVPHPPEDTWGLPSGIGHGTLTLRWSIHTSHDPKSAFSIMTSGIGRKLCSLRPYGQRFRRPRAPSKSPGPLFPGKPPLAGPSQYLGSYYTGSDAIITYLHRTRR